MSIFNRTVGMFRHFSHGGTETQRIILINFLWGYFISRFAELLQQVRAVYSLSGSVPLWPKEIYAGNK